MIKLLTLSLYHQEALRPRWKNMKMSLHDTSHASHHDSSKGGEKAPSNNFDL